MKQWKKFMLVFMCTGIMMGLTACGNNTDDNAANDNSATEGTTGTDDTVKDDVTDRNNENDGVMDEIGDDIQDDNIRVYCALTVPQDITKMTINLKAPIIVDFDTMKGIQLIADNSEYQVRYPIYDILKKEEN